MNFKRFRDGLANIVNQLANRRNPAAQNVQDAQKMSDSEMRNFFRTGMGRRIVGIKRGYALNDTLQFKNENQKKQYSKVAAKHVKAAVEYMLGFGRGAIVIIEGNKNLDEPLSEEIDWSIRGTKIEVFSGDMVFCPTPDIDLRSERYNKPKIYTVRGHTIHHTRVFDFTYVKPPELNLPEYQYGGISEFELIREQMINDGVIQRAGGRIVEINSTLFHKVKGFKDAMQMGNDDQIVKYVSSLADIRGIYGDGIIDAEDDVKEVAQALTNLAEVDQMSLRRVGLVTGIPYPILVGESVGGLNSIGAQERQSFQDTIENLQSDYIADPLARFCEVMGLDDVKFKDNQGGTANERMDYETKAIDNAVKLATLGEDYGKYLAEKDVIKPDPMSTWFPEVTDDEA
jgi:hypothetical protein